MRGTAAALLVALLGTGACGSGAPSAEACAAVARFTEETLRVGAVEWAFQPSTDAIEVLAGSAARMAAVVPGDAQRDAREIEASLRNSDVPNVDVAVAGARLIEGPETADHLARFAETECGLVRGLRFDGDREAAALCLAASRLLLSNLQRRPGRQLAIDDMEAAVPELFDRLSRPVPGATTAVPSRVGLAFELARQACSMW